MRHICASHASVCQGVTGRDREQANTLQPAGHVIAPMETATVEPGNDPMHERTSEKILGESGSFLPPGRMRSRRRSGSSVANETIMTTAKIAR